MKLAHLKMEAKREGESLAEEKAEQRYPDGMRLRIDHHSMKKMGLHKMPAVGDKLHFEHDGEVMGAHQRSPDERHIEVQLTHGGAEPKGEKEKSLRNEIEDAHKKSKPLVSREERLARLKAKSAPAEKAA